MQWATLTNLNICLATVAMLVVFGSFNKMELGRTRPCMILGMMLLGVGLAGQLLGLAKSEWLAFSDTALYCGLIAVLLANQRSHSWVLERFANPAAAISCFVGSVALFYGLLTAP